MTSAKQPIQHIALLGFGEAGAALAQGFCAGNGWVNQQAGRSVQAIDPAFGAGSRGQSMSRIADQLGVRVAIDYSESLVQADLVVSVVTGIEASNAARAARPFLNDAAIYADFNSITGPQTRRVSDELGRTGSGFVDVAVMGSFMANGYRNPLLLSGSDAPSVLAFAEQAGVPARILNDRIGDASAVKILRSVLMKGLEALSVECLVAAHRQGLVDEVLDNVGDVDKIGFAEFVKVMAITHLPHAKRRMEEVEKAIENLSEAGVPAVMSDSTRRSHLRTVMAEIDPAMLEEIDLPGALKILDEQVVGGANR